MGKIFIVDGKLANNFIPLFVQELEKSDCAALCNNLVVMMADFCVRYTALIDWQTFILLSRFLQRDYVYWGGVLFLRFLLSLVDESEKIRQLAEYLYGNILKVKAPLLAYNSFVEAIFILNASLVHKGHTDSQGSRA
nr:condensin-2 complex subunit d3 [Quercus suber]